MSNYYDSLVELTKDPKKSCSYITTVLMAIIKESEDYINYTNNNSSKPNIFLAKEKTFGGRDFSTTNFNFLVLSLFIIISMILTGTVLRKKINSYSGQFI